MFKKQATEKKARFYLIFRLSSSLIGAEFEVKVIKKKTLN